MGDLVDLFQIDEVVDLEFEEISLLGLGTARNDEEVGSVCELVVVLPSSTD